MRCDECKYWDTSEDRGIKGLRVGLCQRAMELWEATEWANAPDYGRVLKEEFTGRRFFAQDGSDYRASVYTTPDFYCADFTPRS